jgi:hypothetical protein
VDFVVCTLAVKKKIRAGFDMSDRTIPLLVHTLGLSSCSLVFTAVVPVGCYAIIKDFYGSNYDSRLSSFCYLAKFNAWNNHYALPWLQDSGNYLLEYALEPRLADMVSGCPQQNAVTGSEARRCDSLDRCRKQTSAGDLILQLQMGTIYFEGSIQNWKMKVTAMYKEKITSQNTQTEIRVVSNLRQ